MSITRSASADIRSLIDALRSADEIRREAAIARLAIIGAHAVDRLLAAYRSDQSNAIARAAVLRALEAIADPRALPIAREALTAGGDVAVAAAAVLRALLDSPAGSTSADALDALVAVALDRHADRRTRMAALDALQDMPDDVRSRVAAAVADDPDASLKVHAGTSRTDADSIDALWQDALEGRLPTEASQLREAVRVGAASTALSALQKLVDTLRTQESAMDARRRDEWIAVRGAVHQALALRGSTVAVYDLRETLTAATSALPTTFITSLHVVGDESCLDAIGAAYTHASGATPEDAERWRQQLAGAFQAIVKRERIARTSASVKRLASKWPEAARVLSKTSRTTPRRKTAART